MTEVRIAVQADDFDIGSETQRLRTVAGDVGAIASFVGICRSEDGTLSALELEHYPGMAEMQIGAMVGDAKCRWPLAAVTVIHRHGKIPVGDNIVLVIAASRHRVAAFEAATFLMDFLKTKAPFWKKEHFADGRKGGWVAATEEDDAATARWSETG